MKSVSLSYTCMPLDRAGISRNSVKWHDQQLQREDTLFVPVWRYQHLVERGDEKIAPELVMLNLQSVQGISENLTEAVFLGLDDQGGAQGGVQGGAQGRAVFAIDLSDQDELSVLRLKAGSCLSDLRRIGPLMDAGKAAVMAYSRAMLYWHRHHQYCGKCGSGTVSQHSGHMRLCLNSNCGKEIYPRTDPAIITLVENNPKPGESPKCLLGHSRRLPAGVYSTLAGFVEPGETLEETVVREVEEESGIIVGSVNYQASQPWPFPGSIMVAFRARAISSEITIDEEELDDVRWFSLEEVQQFGEWEDENAEFRLPRPDSIARFLVDSWLADHTAFVAADLIPCK